MCLVPMEESNQKLIEESFRGLLKILRPDPDRDTVLRGLLRARRIEDVASAAQRDSALIGVFSDNLTNLTRLLVKQKLIDELNQIKDGILTALLQPVEVPQEVRQTR